MWKYKVEYLVVNYEVTMKKRATRYEYAKAYHMIILCDYQDAKSYIIRILILPFIYILL